MVCVGPLTLLGKPGHSPHNGLVLVLVFGQAARRLHQLLSLGLKGTQETFDALDLVKKYNINIGWLACMSYCFLCLSVKLAATEPAFQSSVINKLFFTSSDEKTRIQRQNSS